MDDASDALIAQLLAEDMTSNPYMQTNDYPADPELGDSSDGEWGKSKKKTKKKKKITIAPESKPLKPAQPVPRTDDKGTELTATGRRVRKDKGVKRQLVDHESSPFNFGEYNEEEIKLFHEAIELYGRKWDKISEHMKTRDIRSIKSYAQKYFVRLWYKEEKLPEKVEESGNGYTLSGIPLNPYGSTAKAYLGKKKGPMPWPGVLDVSEPDEDQSPVKIAPPPKREVAVAVVKPKKKPSKAEWVRPASPTEYAQSRPKRNRVQNTDDDLGLANCLTYGDTVVGSDDGPPFSVSASSRSMLLVDLHAHLCLNEVIGFLAGHWNPESCEIKVMASYPVRPSNDTGHDNVEMDVAHQFEVVSAIEKAGLSIIGWYHSHPRFTPDPSERDIKNHIIYQALFRDRPFVAAIIGPYDERLPNAQSAINWFHVPSNERMPWQLRVERTDDSLDMDFLDDVQQLVTDVSSAAATIPVTFSETWRQQTVGVPKLDFGDDGIAVVVPASSDDQRRPYDFWEAPFFVPMDEPCSMLEKLKRSLSYRMASDTTKDQADKLLNGVAVAIEEM